MVTIDVGSLDPGVHELSLTPRVEELELDPEKFRDVHVAARLDVSERRVLLILDAVATATLECDRTLRLFDQEIGGTHYIVFSSDAFTAEAEEAADDVRPLAATETDVDITDIVRDTILLAIPQRCVAPGAEEEEIPTRFGAPDDENDPVDPRWDALRVLKSRADSN